MGLPVVKKRSRYSFALAGRGDRALGCLPCRLHWFLPEEGYRGRREEAATLTPSHCRLSDKWAKFHYQHDFFFLFP